MKKIIKALVVFGTRPEAIKMAPLIKELESREETEVIMCVTAQHREMLDQVLGAFDLEPHYDLNIMQQGQTLGEITTKALRGLENIIKDIRPDIVLVQGDTTTVLAGALAAFYNRVPIGHIEAGLRTYNKYSPFPEEINRLLVGDLADIHFAPTEASRLNLLQENKKAESIYVTGNTVIDALQTTVRDDYENEILDWLGNDKLLLLTVHRRENIGKPMHNIFSAIKDIIEKHKDVKVVYPVHLNPVIQQTAKDVFGKNDRIKLIDPLEVVDFHNLIAKSHIILTDSGGVQEEAPTFGVPVIVLRDTTERPEGIEAGTAKLSGIEYKDIFNIIDKLITDNTAYNKMANAVNPYGNGTASKQIVDIIIKEVRK